MDRPTQERWAAAAEATARGDGVEPDPEEQALKRLRDRTLLVLAVVAHGHGLTRREVRRAATHIPGTTWLSLQQLQRAGLVEREGRAGPHHWLATPEGTRLGVTPYVTRLLGAAQPLSPGNWGAWTVGRFSKVGSVHGPPIFSPAYTLAHIDDPDALADFIRRGTESERAYAVTKLIALHDPASVAILAEVAQRTGHEERLAGRATVALGSFDTPDAIQVLIQITGTRDSLMREAAARGLGRLKAHEAISTLTALIDYPSEPVRAAAVQALDRIGDPTAARGLASALADGDHTVRRYARRALIRLGATDLLKANTTRWVPLRTIDIVRARARSRS